MERKILILTSRKSNNEEIFLWQHIKKIENINNFKLESCKNLRYVLCVIEMTAAVTEILKFIDLIKKKYDLPICVFEKNIIENYPGEREKLRKKADIIIGETFPKKDFFFLIEQMSGLNPEATYSIPGKNKEADLIRIFPDCRKLYINNVEINLTKKEFDIFHYLFQKKGIVVTPKELYENVWKQEYISDDTNIMAHIHRLRYKVEEDPKKPKYICNQYSVGYYFGV